MVSSLSRQVRDAHGLPYLHHRLLSDGPSVPRSVLQDVAHQGGPRLVVASPTAALPTERARPKPSDGDGEPSMRLRVTKVEPPRGAVPGQYPSPVHIGPSLEHKKPAPTKGAGYPRCHPSSSGPHPPLGAVQARTSLRWGANTGRMVHQGYDNGALPSPPSRQGKPCTMLGARLPGPFGLCAGAGFHRDRLSGAPLRDVLLPFVAFQLYRYCPECMKRAGRCQGTGGVLESSGGPATAKNAATRRAPRRYGPCPRS